MPKNFKCPEIKVKNNDADFRAAVIVPVVIKHQNKILQVIEAGIHDIIIIDNAEYLVEMNMETIQI